MDNGVLQPTTNSMQYGTANDLLVVDHVQPIKSPATKVQKWTRLGSIIKSAIRQDCSAGIVHHPARTVCPSHFRMLLKPPYAILQMMGEPDIVAVEKRNVSSCGFIQSGIASAVRPLIGLINVRAGLVQSF